MNFSRMEVLEYARKYDCKYATKYDSLVEQKLKGWLKKYKYLTRDKFIKLGLWKSRRPKKRYESQENDDLTVKEITGFAVRTRSERARVESLTILKGVSFPVSSVILHFAFPNKYPILDFRVIWSLGWKQPKNYDFSFWKKYFTYLRKLSKKYKVDLRTLDKALWVYSKENQKR